MKTVSLSGRKVPALGLGTWNMGEKKSERVAEVAALRRGINLGMTLIDTAEMYADGGSEKVVGEAIHGIRDEVFLVGKIYPKNANKGGTAEACDRSLKRLRVDYLDLYLLHWPGSTPIAETLEAFAALKEAGKIHSYGVSNFDMDALQAAWNTSGGPDIATNQILYNLTRRGVEYDLLPWCAQHNMPVMAYSPVEQGRLLSDPKLLALAKARGVTAAQIALSWVISGDQVIAIPKSSSTDHIEENRRAGEFALTPEEKTALDQAFPPPRAKQALEML